VLWRDSKMTKERAGRTPWKRALIGPGTVQGASGRRVDIRTDDGIVIRGAHIDDLLVIPDDVDDWEKEDLVLGAPDPGHLPRSPGQMIEQGGRGVALPTALVKKAQRGLALHRMVIYSTGRGGRRCSCGKIILMSGLEGTITVHRYAPISDNRLRVKWLPVYIGDDGQEVVDAGTRAAVETVNVRDVLGSAEFMEGE